MKRTLPSDALSGVFPVPPLARKRDSARSLDFNANDRMLRHIRDSGITRFLYGGNAFLYHIGLRDYEALLDWLRGQPDDLWMIPSAGPSFGRLMDQAPLLRACGFPCVMALPSADPRDAAGLERGLREFSDAAAMPLMVYLKDESNWGNDKPAGLDAVARLVDDGVCIAIKYAVVHPDPGTDSYLAELLRRVDKRFVISGIGERPAVVHMRDWGLPGFTTGSGCVGPSLSQGIFEHNKRHEFAEALSIRELFLPLEDLRDAWGPARVLHAAVGAAGIADMGPIAPFISELTDVEVKQLAPVSIDLASANRSATLQAAG